MAVLVKTNVGGGGGVGIEQIIKENGLSDLSIIDKNKGYVSEEKSVDIESLPITLTPGEGVNGFRSVTINKPENLTPEVIVRGENVLGVEGDGSIGSVENLLVPTLGTTTNNGITCTANGDGTYTLNGTSTGTSTFVVGTIPSATWNALVGTSKLIGCPDGGSLDSYLLFTVGSFGNGNFCRNKSGIVIANESTSDVSIRIQIKGTVENVVFKPMLTTNLKATYKEFVKGVEGGLPAVALGAHKVAYDIITFASRTSIIAGSSATFNHSLGETPQAFILMHDINSVNGMAQSDLLYTIFYNPSIFGYPSYASDNGFTANHYSATLVSAGDYNNNGKLTMSGTDSTITITRSGSSGATYLAAGSYYLITMA